MNNTEKLTLGQRSTALFLAGLLGNALVCLYMAVLLFSDQRDTPHIFEILQFFFALYLWGIPFALVVAMTLGHLVWSVAQYRGHHTRWAAFWITFGTTILVLFPFVMADWLSWQSDERNSARLVGSILNFLLPVALMSGVCGIFARNIAFGLKTKQDALERLEKIKR